MIVTEDVVIIQETPAAGDRNLVQRCIEGNQDAWKELVARYQRLIFSIALRICRDSEVSADIMQQVCLELYQRLDEVRNLASLPGWVATVTRRKSYDYLRSLKPTEPLLDDEGPAAEGDVFCDIERQHTLERSHVVVARTQSPSHRNDVHVRRRPFLRRDCRRTRNSGRKHWSHPHSFSEETEKAAELTPCRSM